MSNSQEQQKTGPVSSSDKGKLKKESVFTYASYTSHASYASVAKKALQSKEPIVVDKYIHHNKIDKK